MKIKSVDITSADAIVKTTDDRKFRITPYDEVSQIPNDEMEFPVSLDVATDVLYEFDIFCSERLRGI